MFLGVVAKFEAMAMFNFSGIGFKLVGENLKKCGLSSTVETKDYNARALIDNARDISKDFK